MLLISHLIPEHTNACLPTWHALNNSDTVEIRLLQSQPFNRSFNGQLQCSGKLWNCNSVVIQNQSSTPAVTRVSEVMCWPAWSSPWTLVRLFSNFMHGCQMCFLIISSSNTCINWWWISMGKNAWLTKQITLLTSSVGKNFQWCCHSTSTYALKCNCLADWLRDSCTICYMLLLVQLLPPNEKQNAYHKSYSLGKLAHCASLAWTHSYISLFSLFHSAHPRQTHPVASCIISLCKKSILSLGVFRISCSYALTLFHV